MKRVLVIGPSGAGKSTLAMKLAQKTGLPLVHLDTEYWNPGWIATPDDEWKSRVEQLVARDSWIIEGNFAGTFAQGMPRADTIVLVTRPRWLSIWRVLRRYWQYRGLTRPDLAPDCPEEFDPGFYKWIWDFPNHSQKKMDDALATIGAHASQIIITSDKEARSFLETLSPKTD